MSTIKPSVVRDAFHRRVADALAPRGFVPNAPFSKLKRKAGKSVHLVEFSSSHRNVAEDVACYVALVVEDARVRKVSPGWRAGGALNGPSFAGDVPTNVALSAEADELFSVVLDRLAFFDLLAAPEEAFAQLRLRYVPGLVDPVLIAPYLATHLGADAAAAYGCALLEARPELWPAFASPLEERGPGGPGVHDDHGTQLAAALRAIGVVGEFERPADVVACAERPAAHLRSFFGCQLRAWGEAAAAAALRRVPDDEVLALRAAQEGLGEPIVDSLAAVRLALATTTGAARDPTRAAPRPRCFQYFAKHATFASS
jgi:hypothetical protein